MGIYILIITLVVKRLNALTKNHRLTEWVQKKKGPVYTLRRRDSIQIYRYIETESEMIEKVIPCKWKSKESRSSNT